MDEPSQEMVKAALEKLGKDWNEFKTAQVARIDRLESLSDRLDRVEADRDSLGGSRGKGGATASERKQMESFLRYVREGGKSKSAPEDWIGASSTEYQRKAMSIGTAGAGGNAVPQVMEERITRRMAQVNPIRELCRVVPVETAPSSYKVPVSLGGTAAGWVGESTTRTETTTPTLAVPSFPDAELYAYPRLSSWACEDIPNLEQFIEEEVAEAFGNTEATGCLTGNTSNQPKGIFNNAPVTTDDDASPQRAAFTLEYQPLDTSSPSTGILVTGLVDMMALLKSAYWPRANWIMNRATFAVIRKMRGTDGQFLWQPSLQVGMPSSLLGMPVRICDAMASPGAAGRLPLLLADFMRLYTILERPTRLVVDDNITTPGQVKLYFFKRFSGHVVDDHAGKAGKCVAV